VKLNELIRQAHHLVEAKEMGRITQSDMANRIGVKSRTYTEYQRGTNAPLAMKALLNLLCMLDDHELLKVVHQWNAVNFNAVSDKDKLVSRT
jgi:DNA-binding XRE family transcriptional regulator